MRTGLSRHCLIGHAVRARVSTPGTAPSEPAAGAPVGGAEPLPLSEPVAHHGFRRPRSTRSPTNPCRCQNPWLTTGSVRRASPGQPPDRRCARPRLRGAAQPPNRAQLPDRATAEPPDRGAARPRSRARGRQQTDGALVGRGAVPVVRLRHSIVTATHRHRGGRSRVGKTGGTAGRSGRAPRLTRSRRRRPGAAATSARPGPDGHPDDATAGRPYNCEGRTDGSSA
jgi:hypothetical protein